MSPIKFLYLDVGGVAVLDLTFNDRWEQMLKKLGITSENRPHFDALWQQYSQIVCTTYDADLLVPKLRTSVGLTLPTDFSFTGFLVELFEANPTLSQILTTAREKHIPVGLLTNMYHGMLEKIFVAQKLTKSDYHTLIDSSVVKLQKPDPTIYILAESAAQVQPTEILFVDNAAHNLAPAATRGWQTLLYRPETPTQSTQEVIDYLKNSP